MALSKIQTAEMLDAPRLGRRNLIINGAMQVDQRNETVTNADQPTGDNKFTADRFENLFQDGDSSTRIDSSNVTITDHPLGFSNASKIVCSTVDDLADATSVYMNISYRGIEQQDLQRFQFGTSSAKNLTLSFWVKSGVTGTFFATLQQDANTAGNEVRYHASYTISSANTWEKKTISVAGAGTGLNWLSNNTSDQGLFIMFHLAASSDRLDNTLNAWFEDTTNTQTIRAGTGQTNFFLTADAEFYLTGVQLEEGSTATDFEHRSFGEELSLCQRYYQRISGTHGSTQGLGTGFGSSSTLTTVDIFPPVKELLRDQSAISFSAASSFMVNTNAIAANATNITAATYSNNHVRAQLTATGDSGTTSSARLVRFAGATAFVDWDSEL